MEKYDNFIATTTVPSILADSTRMPYDWHSV
jgi:hypothetical protein